MNQYTIHEGNMDRLTKKLTRISNKCSKFGCSFSFAEVGEEFREVKNERGEKETLRFVLVEVEGVARLNGWRFVASVEHTKGGNIINRADYGVEVPEKFYTSDSVCEHCNTNRTRRDTYVVMNEETGEFKQVGKSCLADFTGGLSASNIASYYSYFEELVQGEVVGSSGGYSKYYDKIEMLHFFAETIRHFGFVKRSADEDGYRPSYPTADRAFNYYSVVYGEWMLPQEKKDAKEEMEHVNFNENSDEAVSDTNAALAWLAEQDASNNYIHNLKTVCGLEYVSGKHFGILASLFATWKRETPKEEERREWQAKIAQQQKTSNHVGDIGERLTITIVSMECVTSWETEWGITRLYKMVDTSGNVLIWKSSKWIDLETAEPSKITGTIKDHTEFNGLKQTELTRCKVA
jgi:hypothetical protein